MSATSHTRPSVVSQALARDRLGVPSVIMFALTAAAPLMVVGALVSSGWGWVGTTGFPIAFVIIAAVLAVFSFGYVAMSRHITNAGAFYSYISQGLGRPLGVAGALAARPPGEADLGQDLGRLDRGRERVEEEVAGGDDALALAAAADDR